jgi:hypothetical protein
MMSPSVYQREAERVENEISARARPVKHKRPHALSSGLDCTREMLPSGCILYRMPLPMAFPIRRELQRDTKRRDRILNSCRRALLRIVCAKGKV